MQKKNKSNYKILHIFYLLNQAIENFLFGINSIYYTTFRKSKFPLFIKGNKI